VNEIVVPMCYGPEYVAMGKKRKGNPSKRKPGGLHLEALFGFLGLDPHCFPKRSLTECLYA
jgi:hypothetical protein